VDDETYEALLESGARLIREFADGLPAVQEILRDHEEDNDEILPTVFLGRISDWYTATWRRREEAPAEFDEAAAFTHRVAARYPQLSTDEQDMIATGFLEGLPYPSNPGRGCIDALPSVLRDERLEMESWNPGE
jgi:hypothetical protein